MWPCYHASCAPRSSEARSIFKTCDCGSLLNSGVCYWLTKRVWEMQMKGRSCAHELWILGNWGRTDLEGSRLPCCAAHVTPSQNQQIRLECPRANAKSSNTVGEKDQEIDIRIFSSANSRKLGEPELLARYWRFAQEVSCLPRYPLPLFKRREPRSSSFAKHSQGLTWTSPALYLPISLWLFSNVTRN